MKHPLISVIIPVYKVEAYLRDCLDSVINQTYRNLEIILVDDGSPDNCGCICDEYAAKDDRVIAIHKKNAGVGAARNIGIQIARGEWISFVDSDDWLELRMYQVLAKYIEESNVDALCFGYDSVYKDYRIEKSCCKKYTFLGDMKEDNVFQAFMKGNTMHDCIIHTSCIQGNIRFLEHLKHYEDGLFRLSLYSKIHSFVLLPQILYHYRMRPDSVTHDFRQIQSLLNAVPIMQFEGKRIGNENHYPNSYIRIINSWTILALDELISKVLLEFRYKYAKKIILGYMKSKEFLEAIQDYDTSLIGRRARLIIKVRYGNMISVYAVTGLRQIYRLCNRIMYQLKRLKS